LRPVTFRIPVIAGCIGAACACLVLLLLHPSEVTRRRVKFPGAVGQLVGDIYRPSPLFKGGTPPASMPGVLICHGVENTKEMTGHLAVEFARRGFVALVFDYGGYGESEPHADNFGLMVGDTVSALRRLAESPGVDVRRLALVGHSMGVSYAVDTAARVGNAVKAVVGLGNEAVAPGVPPRNLLLAMGLYDAFHSVEDMLDAVRKSSGNDALGPYEISGDFENGTARGLYISPLSDHGMEPLDPLLMRETIRWVELSLGIPDNGPASIRETYRAEARILLVTFSGLAATGLLILLFVRTDESRLRRIALRSPYAAVAAAAVAGNIAPPPIALAMSDATLIIAGATSVAAYLVRAKKATFPEKALMPAIAGSLAFGAAIPAAAALSLLAGLLIHGLPAAFTRWEWTAAAPEFIFHILLLRPYEGWSIIRDYSFSMYSQGWLPHAWLGAVMVMELARPGAVTWLAASAARTLLQAFQFKGPVRLRASKRSWIALAIAIAGLAGVVIQRLREGWLSSEAAAKGLMIALKFMVVPLAIFIALVNLPYFRKALRENVEGNTRETPAG